jgi:hypothetical protein
MWVPPHPATATPPRTAAHPAATPAPISPHPGGYIRQQWQSATRGGTMAGSEQQRRSVKPSEQRGGATPDDAEAREKGQWAG